MRAAAIFGSGCSPETLKPFQSNDTVHWAMGMPTLPGEADVIVLFGGDGTIHRHLGQLVKLGSPVLIVPAGSGNDFARALELHHIRDSLAAWSRFQQDSSNVRIVDLGIVAALSTGRESTSDVLSATGGAPHYFCCIAGVGLDCEVARRANKLPRWLRAHGGYALSLIPSVFRFAPVPVKVSTLSGAGGKTCRHESEPLSQLRSDQPTTLAAFANTSSYGGGMKIAPNAKLNDGLLDVCIVGGMHPFKLFCLFPSVYFGRHVGIGEVQYFQASRLRVETDRPLDVYADGEYVCRTPVEVSVAKAALRVVVPEKS